ncbi:MAG TPA: cytochrome D1 domain-containing protein [Acidobacteriota bacterium]|nr:cytochrome D1 domain-containing protein [Acidobacteriota bacterium]
MNIRAGQPIVCLLTWWVLLTVLGLHALAQQAPERQGSEAAEESEPVPGAPVYRGGFESEGIAVDFTMRNLVASKAAQGVFQEGDPVEVSFQIRDTATSTPLSSVYPAAWMDRRAAGETVDDEACRTKIEAFISGSLLTPPELDMNVYHVLAMNNDGTISVVDPLFGFGTTKLLSMIFLPGPAKDWALTEDQTRLFVSVPNTSQVALASTANWKVERLIDVGSQPGRIVLQPDERYLWVGYSSGRKGGINIIDTETLEVVADIPAGVGAKQIVFDRDSRHAFITARDEGLLTVIDVRQLKKATDLELGGKAVSMAYSPVAEALFVSLTDRGQVVSVGARDFKIRARMQADPGLGQILAGPGGRLVFTVNPLANTLHVIDSASNRIVQTGDMLAGPEQLAVTDELLYVRHRDSELVFMIPLAELGREGELVPAIDFPGGQRPFGSLANPTPAPSIVQAPGASAVLVANPADKMIYFYMEGMAAPMGSFKNYGRSPRAVMVVDRSLQERRPGVYKTSAMLRRPGTYDVAFFLDSPRIFHCFQVKVDENPELDERRREERGVDIEPLLVAKAYRVGEEVDLRFRITDSITGQAREGLTDLQVLSFLAPGTWQNRVLAQEAGDGVYRARLTPPQAGAYYVFLSSPQLGLTYKESPFAIVSVVEEAVQAPPADLANR